MKYPETTRKHLFTVEFTDSLERLGVDRFFTPEEAREILWQALYDADKHTPWSLSIVDKKPAEKGAGWQAIRETVARDHREFCGGGCGGCQGAIDEEADELWHAARKD